jgi:hypothetical protein
MMQRCFYPKHSVWPYYGGRGVTVCESWRTFDGFLADMGTAPEGFALGRIDTDGNYHPGTCRWTEQRAQSRGRGRKPTGGKIEARPTRSGEVVFSFLVPLRDGRRRITLGSDAEGWTLEAAERRRDEIVAELYGTVNGTSDKN